MLKQKKIKLSPAALLLAWPLCANAGNEQSAAGVADGLNGLGTGGVIIAVLSFIILLLAGLLIRLRQLRIELVKKSASLVNSEQRMRQMGDNLPNMTVFQLTYSGDGKFRFTYLSRGCERLLGLNRDSVMDNAQRAYDQVYEQDLPILIDAFEKSQRDMISANLEFRVLNQEGKQSWLSINAVPHRDQGVLIWDGFMQDITLRKQVEDALLQENRNFQNLFETIDDFMLVCDMDGRLIHTNPAVRARLDYDADTLRTMGIRDLFTDEAQASICQVMVDIQTRPSTTASTILQTKAGRAIPVELNIFQGYWKNQPAVFGIARDVAGRQQAENALRESQQMLQLIMDTIPMSVFWKDKDSIYLGCNKTFIQECGLEHLDGVVGKSPYDLFPPEQAAAIITRDQDVIRNNHPLFNFTQSLTNPDGSIGWRETSKIPLRNDEGRAVGVLGVWRDITEQNRAEERLKRTLEDMERFNQLMRGRERRTLELKAEINDLLRQLGKTKKYRTTTDDG